MALTRISTDGVKDDAVTAGKIPANAVGTSEIAADAVTDAKIADDAVVQAAIADEAVDEARLQISNAGSNGQYLSKQSGNTGGLTWADVPAGVGGATGVDFNDDVKARFGTGNDLEIYHDGSNSFIDDTGTGQLRLRTSDFIVMKADGTESIIKGTADGAVLAYYDNSKKFETVTGGVTVTGVCTATSFAGDGSSLTGLQAGATGGNSGANAVFWENEQTVTHDYTISNNKNAGTWGPVTINSGVTVTVGDGEYWTIM